MQSRRDGCRTCFYFYRKDIDYQMPFISRRFYFVKLPAGRYITSIVSYFFFIISSLDVSDSVADFTVTYAPLH